jgi:RNA polymerase sigma factor (sigma-70 family)
MTAGEPIVFIVDDDPSVRKGLGRLVRSAGHRAETFASARDFLQREPHVGLCCLVLDVRMPGQSGLELQEALAATGYTMPIIFITGHGDVPTSVRAMKAGAVDFLTKPFQPAELLGAIGLALERDARAKRERAELRTIESRVAHLTPREREVFSLVATGMLNKQIGHELGITEKTVKVHRARVMDKLQAASVADLVRLAEKMRIPAPVQAPSTST